MVRSTHADKASLAARAIMGGAGQSTPGHRSAKAHAILGLLAAISAQAAAQASQAPSTAVRCEVMANAQAAGMFEIFDDGGLQRGRPGPTSEVRMRPMVDALAGLAAAMIAHTLAMPSPRARHASTSAGSATQRTRRVRPSVSSQRS